MSIMKSNDTKPGQFGKPSAKPTEKSANSTEGSKGNSMLDDVAIVSDILATQKTLIKSYGVALCEGSTEKFRGICNTHLSELAEDQYDSFLYMNQRNLYPTDPAEAVKLSEAKQKFKAAEMKIKR